MPAEASVGATFRSRSLPRSPWERIFGRSSVHGRGAAVICVPTQSVGTRSELPDPYQFRAAEAIGCMIIDHPDGLHERVANRGADKFEPPGFQLPAHGIGLGCARRNRVRSLRRILLRKPFDELPDKP